MQTLPILGELSMDHLRTNVLTFDFFRGRADIFSFLLGDDFMLILPTPSPNPPTPPIILGACLESTGSVDVALAIEGS